MDNIEEVIRNNLKRLFAEYLIRAGLPLGVVYPDREAYIIPIWAHQICQLFPQPLDDEGLREKAQKLKGMIKGITTLSSDREKWAEMFEMIDQILALLQPKIEEARMQGMEGQSTLAYTTGKHDGAKQERERIMEIAEKHFPRIRGYAEWQALKGEG